ncbi:unnamed protein product [Polarella glacialis]|uniref:Uncharacterized protein n=1 Tax=Polarella glacialis TaxID=89957 RepID=A0A813HFM5_POLGL|nr:unnamed protein product [Polarella glacialis]
MLGHNVGMFARVAQANQQPTTLMPGTMLSGSYNGSGWKGHNLYWLKNQRPELFQPIDPKTASLINESMKPPEPGFQVFCDGWFMNPQTEEFIDAVTNQRYALVRESGEYCLVREGESWDAELSVGAADASTSSGIRGTAAPCKKLFIADLHRAAQVLKLDLSHLDRPAALFAVFDADGADCVSLAETAAKLFHSKLLPRLAGYRGEWSPDQVKEALSLALTRQTPAGKDGKAPATESAAAALLIGRRLTVIASGPGARCVLSSPRYAVAGSSAFAVHSPEGSWEGYPKEPVKDLVRSPETEESSAEATKSSSSSSGASTQRILPNALPSSLQLAYHKVQIGAAASLPSGASAEASETESSLLAMNQRGCCCCGYSCCSCCCYYFCSF